MVRCWKNVLIFHEMLKYYFNTKFSYLDAKFTDFVLAMPLQKATLMKVYKKLFINLEN